MVRSGEGSGRKVEKECCWVEKWGFGKKKTEAKNDL